MKLILRDARDFWKNSEAAFPHRTQRPIYQPDPADFERKTLNQVEHIVCHIDGMANWAFAELEGLQLFERMYPK